MAVVSENRSFSCARHFSIKRERERWEVRGDVEVGKNERGKYKKG